jgi:hypothetical protein
MDRAVGEGVVAIARVEVVMVARFKMWCGRRRLGGGEGGQRGVFGGRG